MKSRYEQREKLRKIERKKQNKGKSIKIIAFILTIVLLIIVWGKFIEPNILTINDYKIENTDIPESFTGTRIVQFSDVHYGTGFNKHKLNKLINQINSLKPDIVVFTGDLIDKDYKVSDKDVKILIDNFRKINSKLGKYAIVGNHDSSQDEYENIIYDSEFRLLKNNYDTIYNNENSPILIYGFDSSLEGSPNAKGLNEKEASNVPYKIVAVHEPDYIKNFIYDYDVDLILSGHSHNGQINIPLIKKLYLPEGSKDYYNKNYVINNIPVYISNGVGNTFIDFRLFTTPSINIYRLYNK